MLMLEEILQRLEKAEEDLKEMRVSL